MPEKTLTLEEALAGQGFGDLSLEQALSEHAKKVTYPFEQPPEPPPGPAVDISAFKERGLLGGMASEFSKYAADIPQAAKVATEIAVPVATMEIGGGLVPQALVKARPLLGMAVKAGMRALGAGAGGEAAATVTGEKPSLKRGLRTARNVALIEGAVRAPAYMMGRAGGVEPMAAASAQDRPELLKRVTSADYAKAAKDIAKTKVPMTAEHSEYMRLVSSRGQVNGSEYVDRILKKWRANADEPMARNIENKTFNLADKLDKKLGPGGQISAKELDDWIRVNISEPSHRVYEKGAGSAWQERLASLRDDLTPKLYTDVGGGAAELQRAASVKIGKEQGARKMFPEQTPTMPNIQTPTYLRQVLKDNDLGHQVRTRLREFDEVAGTNHLGRIEDLAMRDSWAAAEKAEVEDILANMPAIAYERVGMVRAGARKIGRTLTRSVRPAGRAAAIGSTIKRKPEEE